MIPNNSAGLLGRGFEFKQFLGSSVMSPMNCKLESTFIIILFVKLSFRVFTAQM